MHRSNNNQLYTWMVLIQCIASTTALNVAQTFSSDNRIIGTPVVDCNDAAIALTFKTRKPFTGRVYVRGMANDERCSRNFVSNVDQSNISMLIQNNDCTMQRRRVTGSLEGLMLSLTIVVSFHGTFVTKADRAYRCMCFFRSMRIVTSGVSMSPIGVTELIETAKTPTCTYTIHLRSADGPSVETGEVGEKMYHVWECDDVTQNLLVHSCFVDDGRGTRFDLLNANGCPLDSIIQPDVQYDNDRNRAVAEIWGYKFSDTSVLNYQCTVELCKKSTGECDGVSPPKCERAKRHVNYHSGNRSSSNFNSIELLNGDRYNLITSLNVFDHFDKINITNLESSDLMKMVNTIFATDDSSSVTVQQVCFSHQLALFGFVLSIIISLAAFGILAAVCNARK